MGTDQLTAFLRETHNVCEGHGDVATARLLEGWIDDAEERVWHLLSPQCPSRNTDIPPGASAKPIFQLRPWQLRRLKMANYPRWRRRLVASLRWGAILSLEAERTPTSTRRTHLRPAW